MSQSSSEQFLIHISRAVQDEQHKGTDLHSPSVQFLQVVYEVHNTLELRLLMHIHTWKYLFPHLQEVKALKHMSNLLSISAFVEEIQLQGQILLSFFHQPHELKIWKDLLHNQEKNLRSRKQTISCILAPKPHSYTQCSFHQIIHATNKASLHCRCLQSSPQYHNMPWSCNTNFGLSFQTSTSKS